MAKKELTDDCEIPFGKYKGTKMINLSAAYLLQLNEQSWFKEHTGEDYIAVREYIADNLAVLQKELK